MNSKPKPIKYTGFISHIEWFFYYLVVPKNLYFANDTVFPTQDQRFDYYQRLQNSISFLEILEFRNSKTIPISFQATIELLRLPLSERNPYLAQEDLNKLMLLTVTRIVNMLCDSGDNSKLGRSIGRILQQLNMKDYGLVTEVRHTATHKILPSIQVTRTAAQSLFDFLITNYWDKQFEACAPYLRENQKKVYSFIEKILQEEPLVMHTNLSDWNEIAMVLNSKKGKHKVTDSEQAALQSKNKMKRAMKILDYLNKMIFHLKKFELRQKYIESGGFENDLSYLTYYLKNADRALFQNYLFLEYRLKQIIFMKDLCEEFDKIVQAIESKIPSCLKDLFSKNKLKQMRKDREKRTLDSVGTEEENKGGNGEEKEGNEGIIEEVNKESMVNDINGKIEDEWIPEPLGKNFMIGLDL